VSPRTLILIMLLYPRQSEGDHGPDMLGSMTTDRILAAIDDEIARLKKVRALLSTSTAAAKDNTAFTSPQTQQAQCGSPEEDCRGAAGSATGK
jgi:hypothetical protein